MEKFTAPSYGDVLRHISRRRFSETFDSEMPVYSDVLRMKCRYLTETFFGEHLQTGYGDTLGRNSAEKFSADILQIQLTDKCYGESYGDILQRNVTAIF